VDSAERQEQLDVARQKVAKVKVHARPWRSIIILSLAVILAVVSRSARGAMESMTFRGSAFHALGRTGTEVAADAAAAGFCVLAALGTVGLAGKAREVLQPKIGTAHAAVIRYAIVLLGGLATILITLQLFNIGVGQLLVGGAFATVLLGIAAQQSLSNLFAGLVLVIARPVSVGEQVLLWSGALGGKFRGTVTEIGITYVCLNTTDGPLHLPNSQVLTAAVAPLRHGQAGGQVPASPHGRAPRALGDQRGQPATEGITSAADCTTGR
jgi:small-conductance mechanosensitive channel